MSYSIKSDNKTDKSTLHFINIIITSINNDKFLFLRQQFVWEKKSLSLIFS